MRLCMLKGAKMERGVIIVSLTSIVVENIAIFIATLATNFCKVVYYQFQTLQLRLCRKKHTLFIALPCLEVPEGHYA